MRSKKRNSTGLPHFKTELKPARGDQTEMISVHQCSARQLVVPAVVAAEQRKTISKSIMYEKLSIPQE